MSDRQDSPLHAITSLSISGLSYSQGAQSIQATLVVLGF